MAGPLTFSPALPAVVCTPTPIAQIDVDLFGGGKFSLPMLPRHEDPVALIGRALSGMGMQFAPMAPLVRVLRILSSVIGIVKAVATLDVPQIAAKAAELGVAVADIAALIGFPIQMARSIRGFLTMLIAYLEALRAQVNLLVARYSNVNALIAKAQSLGNDALLANALCAKERLDAKVAQMNAAIVALGVAVQIFSIVLCLVSGGHLDPLPTLDVSNLTGAVFDPVIAALTAVRDAIPNLAGLPFSCS